MKIYKTTLRVGAYDFALESDSITEAYDAMRTAVSQFDMQIDLEEVMECLVSMRNGGLISKENYWYKLRVIDTDDEKNSTAETLASSGAVE